MMGRTRAAGLCLVATATVAMLLTLPGALAARRAVQEAALEVEVLAANIEYLESKLAADARNWLLAGHLAELYEARFRMAADGRDITRAESLIRTTLPLRLDPSPGFARLSALLLAQHRFSEAYEAARAAVAAPYPGDLAYAALADAARAFGEDAVADSALARMTPGTFATAVRLAETLPAEDAWQRVRRGCDRLTEQGASRDLRAWCITRLAALEQTTGSGATRRRLDEALAVQPDHRGALEAAADLAYASGDYARARRLYARILSDAHPDLSLRLAEVNRLMGREVEADRHEQRFVALASDPRRQSLAGLELAVFRARRGECDTARPLAAAELDRRHAVEVLEGVAWVHHLCGDRRQAEHLLVRAGSRLTATGEYLRALLRRGGDPASAAAKRSVIAEPAGLAPYAIHHLRTSGVTE